MGPMRRRWLSGAKCRRSAQVEEMQGAGVGGEEEGLRGEGVQEGGVVGEVVVGGDEELGGYDAGGGGEGFEEGVGAC